MKIVLHDTAGVALCYTDNFFFNGLIEIVNISHAELFVLSFYRCIETR